MKKKIIALLSVVALSFAMLAGCSQPSSSGNGQTSPASSGDKATTAAGSVDAAEKKTFRVAAHNATTDNGWRIRYENQLKEVADQLKDEGIITEFVSFSANNDPATMSANIEQTINEGYDIILVNPISSTGLDPLIEKALEKGITYVNVDCEYESGDKILNVTTDQAYWATQSAEFVAEKMGGKGNLVIFNGIDGNSASEIRKEAFHQVLEKYPDIKVVKEVAHNWSQVESKQIMNGIISSGLAYDAILNQEAGLGILQALEEAKAPFPKAITSDEEVGYLRKLAEINKDSEKLPFYIIENPPGIGATALKFAVRLAQGKELKDGMTKGENNAIYIKPQWTATYETMAKALEETKDLPETEFISTYYADKDVDAFFK